jgi:hypothetical protein
MKAFLFRSLIGIFFGAFLSVMITNSIIYFGKETTLDGHDFLKNSLGSIFCGWFFSVTPFYFEISSLKLWQQTVLHFITVSILYFTLALGIGWYTITTAGIFLMVGIFLSIYVAIWTGFYLYFRTVSKKLNHELKNIN